MAGSRTACAACSSLTGVLSHIFFSFIATGESESSAVATASYKNGNICGNFFITFFSNLQVNNYKFNKKNHIHFIKDFFLKRKFILRTIIEIKSAYEIMWCVQNCERTKNKEGEIRGGGWWENAAATTKIRWWKWKLWIYLSFL